MYTGDIMKNKKIPQFKINPSILTFFIFLLLIISFYIPTVSSADYITDFEDGILGQRDYNGTAIEIEFLSGDTSITDIYPHSGLLSYGGVLGYPHNFNLNFTYDNTSQVMTSLTMYWRTGDPTDDTNFYFNQSGINILRFQGDASSMKMWTFSDTQTIYFDDKLHAGPYELWGWYFNSNQSVTFWVDDINTGNSSTGSPVIGNVENYHIDRGFFNVDSTSILIDDISYITGTDYGEYLPGGAITLKFYDNDINFQYTNLIPYDLAGPLYPISNWLRFRAYSDLWTGELYTQGGVGTYTHVLTIDDDFAPGSYHWFNFTNVIGWPNGYSGESVPYPDSTNYLQCYAGQTFTILLNPIDIYGGFSNCREGGLCPDNDFGDSCFIELCTDKQWYTQGETVSFRYSMPTAQWLYTHGEPSADYELWIYDKDNLGWLWGETDGGDGADNGNHLANYTISLDGQYHYLNWVYNPSGDGYKTVTGGIDGYRAFIGVKNAGSVFWGLITVDAIYAKIDFNIEGGIFTPSGNITSVSPDPAYLGQQVAINFNVNNNGYMTVRNLLSSEDTAETIETFPKFTGTETTYYSFWQYGRYIITLYVSDGIGFTNVDTYQIS